MIIYSITELPDLTRVYIGAGGGAAAGYTVTEVNLPDAGSPKLTTFSWGIVL
jgi:hypothetical protein